MDSGQNNSRRGLLLGLAGLSAVAWGWQRFGVSDAEFSFEAIPGLPDWRSASVGTTTGGSAADAVLVGIGQTPVAPLTPDVLCQNLYTGKASGLPVAVFTDINCPNCRSLEAKLEARKDQLSITWLQLPLLGPASEQAALVAVASEHLSGVPAVPPRGIRGLGITPIIQFHAERAGLEVGLLGQAHKSVEARKRLHLHARIAETLGVWGTPAMTVGKTLVMGDMSDQALDTLIAMDHGVCSQN